MKKVLLINPLMCSGNEPARYQHLSPPLGIMSLAAFLRSKNIKVDILDLIIEPKIDIVDYITQVNPDVVGITSMTGNFPFALEIAEKVKSRFQMPIIFGGPHPTILPKEVLQNEAVDYVVIGEGEYTFEELLQVLEGNLKAETVLGIGYKENGEIVINERRKRIVDLDSIPFPAYDLINNEAYIYHGGEFLGFRHITMLVSRGCPGKCTFCAQHLTMGREFRAFSPKRVVDEIQTLIEQYNAEGIWFKDSTFTMSREWTMEFCEEILRRDFVFKWASLNRVDEIDLELAKKMKESGLVKIWLGAEVGSDRLLLDILNKEITVEMVKEAFRICKSVGIETAAFFMFGLPTETKEDIRKTFELARELDSRPMQLAIYHPLSGTELYQKYNGAEVVKHTKAREMAFDKACMSTGPLSKEELQIVYDEIVNYFFGDGKEPEFLYL